jgi:hypothetical protein
MANEGIRNEIELKVSVNTDSINENVSAFGDASANLLENTGIERNGGITNIYETETLLGNGSFAFADNGDQLSALDAGSDTLNILSGASVIGQVSAYGVEKRTEIEGAFDDVALTADDTYVSVKIVGTVITYSEYSRANVLLNTRNINFTNLSAVVQFFTSLSIVRASVMHYASSAEFALRIGDQVIILQESNPGISLAKFLQSTAVLGSNAINCSVIYNNQLIMAGVGGRLGSYDGANWKNYDATGTGLGPYNNATALGTSDIKAMVVFNNTLVIAGAGGRMASFDGVAWRNYDGSGGSALYFDNGTLIGTNQINAMFVFQGQLVVGGVGGRVGNVTSAGAKNIYTAATSPIVSNATIVGSNDILTICGDQVQFLVGAVGGRVASYDYGWIDYTGVKSLGSIARTSTAAAGSGWYGITYGNGIFVAVAETVAATGAIQTSPDGVNWTARTGVQAGGLVGLKSVAFGNGVFVAIATGLSVGTQAVQTSPDGINWTQRTCIAASGTGWTSVCYGGGLFVAVALTTSTTGAIQTSPDGINWTQRTSNAAGGTGWTSVTYGSGVYVAVALTTATSGAVQTSTDGITWTPRTSTASAGTGWKSVVYGGGLFVAVGGSTATAGAIQTSPDGQTWTARTSTAAAGPGWESVSYGNGVFVAVSLTTATAGAVQTSIDGINWVSRTSVAGGSTGWYAITFGGGTFVAITHATATFGAVQTLHWNSSGIFNNSTALSTDNITASLKFGSAYVFGSALGKVASHDGTNWKNYNGTGTGTGPYNNAAVIGANQINSIAEFGANLLVAGSTRVGSFDGTNWKNSDGTGTGTGQYTSALLGASTINTIASFSGSIVGGGTAGVVNSMSSTSVVSPFYNNGGTPVANLLTGQFTTGYMDVFRYENGIYLIGLVNNNLNKYYTLNNSTLDITVLNARYALAQTVGGLTRHILTETPRFDGSRMYAISTVGYIDFVTFTAVQTYPADASVLSAVLQSNVGWGYSDYTYKLSSSATNIFAAYSPIPVPTTSALSKTSQVNTNTLVVGYGKLTNGPGAPTSKPFEIRLNWIATGDNKTGTSGVGGQSHISAALKDSGTTDALGVILHDVGTFDEGYTPQIVTEDTILWKYNGKWYIVHISKTINDRIQRINSNLYKVNTLSPLNIIDEIKGSLELGSPDFNGRMFFNSIATPAATSTKAVSTITGKYCNSIDFGDKLVQIPAISRSNVEIFGYRIPSTNRILTDYFVDTYFDDVYSFSTYNDGSEFTQTDPANPLYIPSGTLPVPLGVVYQNGVVISNKLTIFLGENMDAYAVGNDTVGVYQPFSLFGQPYLFDGIDIYIATLNNGAFVKADKLVNASGMSYIGVSPQEAYFRSTFDNSLYSFNGGRTLQKVKRFTNEEIIINGEWSTKDNALLLNTENTFMWVRDSIVSRNYKKPGQLGALKFFSTNDGLIIMNDSQTAVNSWKYTYYPDGATSIVPLLVQTAYFGQNGNQKSILQSFIVTIYSKAMEQQDVTLTVRSFSQVATDEQVEKIPVKQTDYTDQGYARLRIQPRMQTQLGTSLSIASDKKVQLVQIDVLYVDNVNATIKPSLTR